MPINVAHIPNLECEAFYIDMERRGIELRNLEPSEVTKALEKGEVDAGPVSLVDTFRVAPMAVPISGFCVASVARAVSSVLLSKAPIEDLSGSRIALGDGDATSVSLLQALLTLKHEVRGEVFVDQQSGPRRSPVDGQSGPARPPSGAWLSAPVRLGGGMAGVDRAALCLLPLDGQGGNGAPGPGFAGGCPFRWAGGLDEQPVPGNRGPATTCSCFQGSAGVRTGTEILHRSA